MVWFDRNQDCNQTKGTSFIANFGCNPDCFDYERNAIFRKLFGNEEELQENKKNRQTCR